jgi:hypothetical protein
MPNGSHQALKRSLVDKARGIDQHCSLTKIRERQHAGCVRHTPAAPARALRGNNGALFQKFLRRGSPPPKPPSHRKTQTNGWRLNDALAPLNPSATEQDLANQSK